jgi:hypothetical protein
MKLLDNSFFISKNYESNLNASHHDDTKFTDEGQKEVYEFSKKLADEENLNLIVDIGCGSGYKLIKYFNEKNTIGIETEPCFSHLKKRYPDKRWIESEQSGINFPNFEGKCDLIICSDVIEHIINPQNLLNYISQFDFKYLIISTPDRAILRDKFATHGLKNWYGPPLNPCHVREWEHDEFFKFLNLNFEIIKSFHCEKQIECMAFLCKKKKVLLTSASFGENERSIEIPLQKQSKYNHEIVLLNDNNTKTRKFSLHPRLKGKIPKMLQWMEKEAEYYIWIDSKFDVISDTFIYDTIEALQNYDIILCKHTARSSISDECKFVVDAISNHDQYVKDRYDGEKIQEQTQEYLKDKTFIDDKLFALGFFAYSKNLVKNKEYNLMTDWFFHNCYWSIQDQISFPYLLHKHKVNYKIFDFHMFKNSYIKHRYFY